MGLITVNDNSTLCSPVHFIEQSQKHVSNIVINGLSPAISSRREHGELLISVEYGHGRFGWRMVQGELTC